MDLKQEEITTLHDICINKRKLVKTVKEATNERPASVIMPMLYKEIKSDALSNIVKGLNKCDYLSKVVIPLAADNKQDFLEVKKFFRKLETPHLIM